MAVLSIIIACGMKLEVLSLFGTKYAIFELDGDGDPVEVSSAVELRDHLRNRGLSEQQISEVIEDLETEPRQIRVTVSR
jgi:hypothetical protein